MKLHEFISYLFQESETQEEKGPETIKEEYDKEEHSGDNAINVTENEENETNNIIVQSNLENTEVLNSDDKKSEENEQESEVKEDHSKNEEPEVNTDNVGENDNNSNFEVNKEIDNGNKHADDFKNEEHPLDPEPNDIIEESVSPDNNEDNLVKETENEEDKKETPNIEETSIDNDAIEKVSNEIIENLQADLEKDSNEGDHDKSDDEDDEDVQVQGESHSEYSELNVEGTTEPSESTSAKRDNSRISSGTVHQIIKTQL